MRPEDKEKVLALVKERVLVSILGDAELEDRNVDQRVESILGETIFLEMERLEHETDKASRRRLAELVEQRRKLFKLSAWGRRKMLASFVEEFSTEVLGHWDNRVYRFATKVLPVTLSTLLNAMSPGRFLRSLPELPNIDDRVVLDGDVELVRSLYDHGNIVYAPTHLSNLDSIILGYGLYANGFPPVTYGAGINLFANPMLSFFMHRLGAYKVDRKKKNSLYKQVLKEYATATIELGYPNLFFPGGTRSRSGAVEEKLKLGLLGCGLVAYINNLQQGRPRPKVFIVPVNLSYQHTLEAENLIEDFLKEEGKSRSIITDDEFQRPGRIYDFVQSIFELDAKIYMTFGAPHDCFGNKVDGEGRSRDKRGRLIDPERYTWDRDGKPVHRPQRDAQYTREVGQILVREYKRCNTIMSTHLLAFTVFHMLRARHVGGDIYRFIREARIDEHGLALIEVERALERLITELRAREARDEIRLDPPLRTSTPHELLQNGLRDLAQYHTRAVVERRGDRLFVTQAKLLYYYRNRLQNYGLEPVVEDGPEAGDAASEGPSSAATTTEETTDATTDAPASEASPSQQKESSE